MTDVCCFGAVHRYPKPKYTGKVITELFICNFTFYLGREGLWLVCNLLDFCLLYLCSRGKGKFAVNKTLDNVQYNDKKRIESIYNRVKRGVERIPW